MTEEGYRVTIIRISNPDADPADISIRLNAIQALSSFDVRLQEDTYCAGDVMVVDFKHAALKHLRALSVTEVHQWLHCAVVSSPVGDFVKLIEIGLYRACQ